MLLSSPRPSAMGTSPPGAVPDLWRPADARIKPRKLSAGSCADVSDPFAESESTSPSEAGRPDAPYCREDSHDRVRARGEARGSSDAGAEGSPELAFPCLRAEAVASAPSRAAASSLLCRATGVGPRGGWRTWVPQRSPAPWRLDDAGPATLPSTGRRPPRSAFRGPLAASGAARAQHSPDRTNHSENRQSWRVLARRGCGAGRGAGGTR